MESTNYLYSQYLHYSGRDRSGGFNDKNTNLVSISWSLNEIDVRILSLSFLKSVGVNAEPEISHNTWLAKMLTQRPLRAREVTGEELRSLECRSLPDHSVVRILWGVAFRKLS